jgi:ABC-type sugar transport system, permease component
MIVTIPTVILTLLFSAAAAFGLSRYRVPFRRTILLMMLAATSCRSRCCSSRSRG